jgi:hypothetical protein
MVWMYKCESSFSSCDGSGKGWFKIDQSGMTAPPLNGKNWGQAKLPAEKKWTVEIPKLRAGNYLLRHEIVTIHTSNAPQFYAECAQLNMTGSGGGMPTEQYMVKIPGYASMNHPGLKVYILCDLMM